MKNRVSDGGSTAEIKRKKPTIEAGCSSLGKKEDQEGIACDCSSGREYQKLRVEEGEGNEKSEDEETSMGSDQWPENFNSLGFYSDDSSICSSTEEFPNFDAVDSANSTMTTTMAVSLEGGPSNSSMKLGEMLGERISHQSLSPSQLPHWGLVSICGRRPEMEDASAVMPYFLDLPPWMGSSASVDLDSRKDLARLSGHFFGVYDGHGGAQVANYCRERMHVALEEEMTNLNKDPSSSNMDADEWKKKWESIFTNCFLKVDDEIGGKPRRVINDAPCSSELIAPDTVGSTAVVALVFSSHIIVANCGDSRAVICRGKQPIPLSVDHKPNREDEYKRIEKAKGKVIHWNGYRVFGVLAMSRSIGDRYLKPWVIADPEVNLLCRSKEDEVLVLASDGLWDVLSNEEVCTAARKRILLWYRKNIGATSSERESGVDPAAQAAADYLMKLALQKGSKDNITIIVVDLRPHRRVRTKPPVED